MEENFIAKRLTELRLKKGISEYKMSMDMGHSGSYIHSIASGKALPSMSEFLYLCEYLGITPQDFFDEDCGEVLAVRKLCLLARTLHADDLSLLTDLAERLSDTTPKKNAQKSP